MSSNLISSSHSIQSRFSRHRVKPVLSSILLVWEPLTAYWRADASLFCVIVCPDNGSSFIQRQPFFEVRICIMRLRVYDTAWGSKKCLSEVLSHSGRANQTRPLLVRKWLFTCSVSIHYLNQCWLTVICALGNIWFITHYFLSITKSHIACWALQWKKVPIPHRCEVNLPSPLLSVVILLDQLILSVASMPIKGTY